MIMMIVTVLNALYVEIRIQTVWVNVGHTPLSTCLLNLTDWKLPSTGPWLEKWLLTYKKKKKTKNKQKKKRQYLWEKAMAPHSSTLAWKIRWTEEPGRLQSMGSLRVGHDWAPSLSLLTFMHWRRKGQPTPVFLPGESQRRGSLVGCRLWGSTESDTTEAT